MRFFTTLFFSLLLTCSYAEQRSTEFDIHWIQDQHVLSVNREAGHATLIPYASKAALLADEYHQRPWVGRALRMILEWLDLHREELLECWERAQRGDALGKIAPLS